METTTTPVEDYVLAIDAAARERAVVIGQIAVDKRGLIGRATLTLFTTQVTKEDSRLASLQIDLIDRAGQQTLTVRPGASNIVAIGRQGHGLATRGFEDWIDRLSQEADLPNSGCFIAVAGRRQPAMPHHPLVIDLIGRAIAVELAYQQQQRIKASPEYALLLQRVEELLDRGRQKIAGRDPI